jgi:hypothetical protein
VWSRRSTSFSEAATGGNGFFRMAGV